VFFTQHQKQVAIDVRHLKPLDDVLFDWQLRQITVRRWGYLTSKLSAIQWNFSGPGTHRRFHPLLRTESIQNMGITGVLQKMSRCIREVPRFKKNRYKKIQSDHFGHLSFKNLGNSWQFGESWSYKAGCLRSLHLVMMTMIIIIMTRIKMFMQRRTTVHYNRQHNVALPSNKICNSKKLFDKSELEQLWLESSSERWMTVDVTHCWRNGVPRVRTRSREGAFAEVSSCSSDDSSSG